MSVLFVVLRPCVLNCSFLALMDDEPSSFASSALAPKHPQQALDSSSKHLEHGRRPVLRDLRRRWCRVLRSWVTKVKAADKQCEHQSSLHFCKCASFEGCNACHVEQKNLRRNGGLGILRLWFNSVETIGHLTLTKCPVQIKSPTADGGTARCAVHNRHL